MKDFRTVFNFELKQYFKNKLLIGITAFLVVLIAIVMFIPRFIGGKNENDSHHFLTAHEENSVMLIKAEDPDIMDTIETVWQAAFPRYTVRVYDKSLASLRDEIIAGEASCAFVFDTLEVYTYYVNNLSLYDYNTEAADEVLRYVHQITAMTNSGMTESEIDAAMSAKIQSRVYTLGKDQGETFLYTYIMIFALYLVILLYGQMIASKVATEKSSRVMELLITSIDSNSLIFGKVLASCLAGVLQLATMFGSFMVFYRINEAYWDASIIQSLFNIPSEQFVYLLVFFALGFLIYAFLYGAVGSFATKLEDINTSVLPLTILLMVAFIVVIFSVISGKFDNYAMIICSYIPLTSPIAMYARIAMSTVSFVEVAISIIILVVSTIVVGFFGAKVYRMGVLLYGTPPSIRTVLSVISKKRRCL